MGQCTRDVNPFEAVRADFPLLKREVYGKPLVYFDNAATTQKPTCVLERLKSLYGQHNANIHRGVHSLSGECTELYEEARARVASYLGVSSARSVVFTSGATAAINLAAFALGESFLKSGDVVLVSEQEHHSNLVPWQLMGIRKGVEVVPIPIQSTGHLNENALQELLLGYKERVKLVCVTHASNTLGVVNNLPRLSQMVHAAGAYFFVDGAQGVKHGPLSLEKWGVDFYAFSGHKIYAPTGIGVLWGRTALMDSLPPWQGGGDMVGTVSFHGTTFAELPQRLEAGTPPYIQAIALATALDYYTHLQVERVLQYESALLLRAYNGLSKIEGMRFLCRDESNAAIVSFVVEGVHPYDLGVLLDKVGIAVRTGLHCTEPLHRALGLQGSVRASFAFYNTPEEVDFFTDQTARMVQMLRG